MTTVTGVDDAKPGGIAQRHRTVTRALLACGILSSLLYVATDILGGLLYPGYSFLSQAISELGAVGAPSAPVVDPLFATYTLLTLAFGIGVLREATGSSRALRMTGALLVAYGSLGFIVAVVFADSNFFKMQQRGAGSLATDLPHIVLTAVLVLLLLCMIGVGAFALGKRFRIYSVGTLLTLITASALTVPLAARLAAGEPTPGFGLVERIDVYSALLWIAVLATALLERRSASSAKPVQARKCAPMSGMVAPGFEEVRAEFARNFAERGEIGAAVAAYWRGEKVVDLWGGWRTPNGDEPWREDTMVPVMSTTKGLAAMTCAIANARGWLDYDAPVARYWPEFAQNGKAAITVRQLLGHEAGLVLLDEPLSTETLRDLDAVARMLARQKPAWPPGSRHGYHTLTVGLYMQEPIRRVDPARRTLGQFFRDEIATPLGLDFYIGLPRDIPRERVATVKTLSRRRGLMALRYTPPAVTLKMIKPRSLLRRSFVGLAADPNDRAYLEVEVPAGNGVGTARAIARAYSAFAEGGAELGLTPDVLARLTAQPRWTNPKDEVLGIPSHFSLGFARPGPEVSFGVSPRAFGSPGAGGSFAFADPDARLGYAYAMNKLDFYIVDDPREKALRDAVYRAVMRLAREPVGKDRHTFERSDEHVTEAV